MKNKLVAIINSIKVPKIKKILVYEMKFLVPNYSCLQNPWLGGYCPQIPILSVLCPQPNLLNPPPNKIPGYATAGMWCYVTAWLVSYVLRWLCCLTASDTNHSVTWHHIPGNQRPLRHHCKSLQTSTGPLCLTKDK